MKSESRSSLFILITILSVFFHLKQASIQNISSKIPTIIKHYISSYANIPSLQLTDYKEFQEVYKCPYSNISDDILTRSVLHQYSFYIVYIHS